MTRVAVVGFAGEVVPEPDGRNDAELLVPLVDRALSMSGLAAAEIDILATASSELLTGVVGGVMGAFDALPGWPPRTHSHLDADGAFACYEGWVRLLAGEGRAAVVCAFCRPLGEDRRAPLGLQLDPYVVAPLRPPLPALAALQARAMLDSGRWAERDLAAVTAARRGLATPSGVDAAVDDLLRRPYVTAPLRALDCSTVCSGAAALVLAADDLATRSADRPAWIAGMAHRTERHSLGARDLATSPSVRALAAQLGVLGSDLGVAEVHAPYSHQELLVLDALGASGIGSVNPSGGALPADPVMVTGLLRIGAAADAVRRRRADRALGHATNGPCLQHNLLCLLEAAR